MPHPLSIPAAAYRTAAIRSTALLRAAAILTTALLTLALPPAANARDNFLVIVLDDVGVDMVNVYSRDDLYGHPGEGGNPGSTPNMDQLAADGVLFRNAWSNPLCSPTRAQLLTGRHGFRTGIGTAAGSPMLGLSETTLAELMAPTHHTAALGKWHLGGNDLDNPNEQGFGYFAGALGPALGGYYSWPKVTNGTEQSSYPIYATTDNVDEALVQIQAAGDAPWFVWLAFNAAHVPFHVPPDDLQSTGITVNSSSSAKARAMIEAADSEIGRLLANIPQPVLEDTTIFLIGDNGSTKGGTVPPFIVIRSKGTVYEGGLNVPLIVVSPVIAPEDRGSESLALVSSVDLFATVLDIAGVEGYAEDSLSFLPSLEDPSAPTSSLRPHVYAERFAPNGPGPYTEDQRAVRDATYKLIWRDGVYEEFYNLVDDRWEQTNLLPVANLTAEERAAYDALVLAMENRATPLPPVGEPGAPIPTLPGWGSVLLGCGLALAAAARLARRAVKRAA